MKWEKPEKIHLTLRFLGEIEQQLVDNISESLPHYLKMEGIDLRLNGPGAFPGFRKPRVLFVGLNKSSELTDLKINVDNCLGKLGFDPEQRDFVPHLTIGRVKKPSPIPRSLPGIEPLHFRIENIVLFRSKLDGRGSVHIPIRDFKLL